MTDSEGKSKSVRSHSQTTWWDGIPGSAHVVKLNASNYENLISNKPAFIMYYAQWCGYSKNSRNAFAAVADQLSNEGNPILIGAVDADECKEICRRYPEVNGYPSFLYLLDGIPKKSFRHSRTKEAFYTWITEVQNKRGLGLQ